MRTVLKRIVESIHVLVVARGVDRLAAVQINFVGGKRRDYLILHRPAKSNGGATTPGGWWARSLAGATALGDLDLGKATHAKRLEAALAALGLDEAVE